MAEYTARMFGPHKGSTFVFANPENNDGIPGEEVKVELVEIKRLGAARGSRSRRVAKRQPFSLLFRSKQEQPVGDRMIRLSHADFAPEDWFVTRVTVWNADGRYAYYEAIFN